MLLSLCFVFVLCISADLILKPTRTSDTEAALIFLPGSGLTVDQYSHTFTSVQFSALSFNLDLFVVVLDEKDGTTLNTAVPRALNELQAAGISSGAKIFYGAHSPTEGLQMQDYLINGGGRGDGIILFGGFINRDFRPLSMPSLTLAGELDGVCRITRCGAEEYYHQVMYPDSRGYNSLVLLLSGASHMSFVTGSPTRYMLTYDFQPEVSGDDAVSDISTYVAAFLGYQVSQSTLAQSALDRASSLAKEFMKPIVDVMEVSGNQRLRDPCNSDFPTNPTCEYPKYPDASLNPLPVPKPDPMPPVDCMCGSSWLEDNAQQMMADFSGSSNAPWVTMTCKNSFHDVADVHPFHLPHIFNSCAKDEQECVLNVTSVTQPLYKDDKDVGYMPIAAYELKTKLKSRQAMYQAVGLPADNMDDFDKNMTLCREINEASFSYAFNKLPSSAQQRYSLKGEPLVPIDDHQSGIGITGPTWIGDEMLYNRELSSSGFVSTKVTLQSFTFLVNNINQGDVPFWITAGYHYCKVLSPFKAMEWALVDSLREYQSLANVTQRIH